VAEKLGVARKGWSTGPSWGDYDGDGRLDLFVPGYVDFDLNNLPPSPAEAGKSGAVGQNFCQFRGVAVMCGPRGLPGETDTLYHQKPDGSFEDASAKSGVNDPQNLLGLTAVWSDFDNSGKLQLFVANDGAQNYLYRSDGKGRFTEIGFQAGVALDENGKSLANMGVALGDYLHSGYPSIALTHFSEQYLQLFRNDGGLSFTDVSNISNIARATTHVVGWGDAFYDFDNDGWMDLIAVNGHVYPQVDQAKIGIYFREPGQLFLNQRDGTFRDVSAQVGPALKVPRVGRGLALGDLFNDGIQEVVVENLEGEPVIFRPEGGPRNHWISLELAGTRSNKLALNARVRITAGELSQTDEVRSSGSYLSQSDLRLHFGLADQRRAGKVEIFWPSGGTETLTNLEADRFYCVKEGAGVIPCAGIRPTAAPTPK